MKIISAVLGLVLLCVGCRNATSQQATFPRTNISTANAFSLFAGVTVPALVPSEVSDLQADGAIWMDMHVTCRFRAPTQVIDSILSNGYQRTEWVTITDAMLPSNYTNSFSPGWAPNTITHKECYLQRLQRDHATDMLYLVVDRPSGIVYGVAEGFVY